MMHQPNLVRSSGTRVLLQPPSGADTSEPERVFFFFFLFIPAAAELSGYF